ncbi:MAG: AAA family ATPase [Candidatus Hodarchaeales archaeon]|jgi:vacuolar protein-sorting-associated protein 4
MSTSKDPFDETRLLISKALQHDKQKKYQKAVDYYIRAAENLIKLYTIVPNQEIQEIYYDTAKDFVQRAREIKQEKTRTVVDNEFSLGEKPRVNWNDVVGMEEAKKALKEALILPMSRPDLFEGARKAWRGILLFGPPGCGKTFMAKAIAGEVNATFYSVPASSIFSKWLGESEKQVQKLYDNAYRNAPSIVFIDECEALVGTRSSGEHDAVKRVKTQLLQALDGVNTPDKVITVTIGATNIPWEIDMAMRRRFQKRIYIPIPDEPARAKMFEIHTRGIKLDIDVDFNELASLTEDYTGSDVSIICREAMMLAIRELDFEKLIKDPSLIPRDPSRNDFLKAIDNTSPSVMKSEMNKYLKWKNQFGS